MTDCPCLRCTAARHKDDPPEQRLFGLVTASPIAMARMFCCETCGNKRCPHSDDHRNACTGSNAPGQPGSRYADGPMKGHDPSLTANNGPNIK